MRSIRELLFYKVILTGLRITEGLRHRAEQIASFIGAAALAGLSKDSLRRLTDAIYGCKDTYGDDKLFDWEREWLAADLPPPPAKILLGGAGSGREVLSLSAQGYEILAFDPVLRFVKNARLSIGCQPGVEFVQGSYEDIVSNETPQAQKLHTAIKRFVPYDAVVLGWSSFTHIIDTATRVQLLKRLYQLCPNGPVLLSFWMRDESEPSRARGRAYRLGTAIGTIMGPNTSDRHKVETGDVITGHAGFCHSFTLEEIELCARQAGYSVSLHKPDWLVEAFPHMTLLPPLHRIR